MLKRISLFNAKTDLNMQSLLPRKISRPQVIIFISISLIFLGGPIAYLTYKFLHKNDVVVKSYPEALANSSGKRELENPTHRIDIPNGIGKLTLRNRPLSLAEYRLGSSGTPEGEVLNAKTVITYIDHGELVQLLDLVGNSYKIRVATEKEIIEGYIAKGVGSYLTLKSIMHYK